MRQRTAKRIAQMSIDWNARKELEGRFPSFACALVAALPGSWSFEQRTDQSAKATRADGLSLSVYFNGEKVEVTPSVPSLNGGHRSLRDWGVIPYNASAPSAGVSMARSPEACAKDVARKVVTPYESMFAAIVAKNAEILEYQGKAHVLAVEVAALLEQPRGLERHSPGNGYSFTIADTAGIYGSVDIAPHGSTEIKLRSMSPAQVRSLLAWLRGQS